MSYRVGNTLKINRLNKEDNSLQLLDEMKFTDKIELANTYSKLLYVYEERLLVPYNTLGGAKVYIIHFCYGEGCTNFCIPYCGDGTVDPDEDCDDANSDADDGCTSCSID